MHCALVFTCSYMLYVLTFFFIFIYIFCPPPPSGGPVLESSYKDFTFLGKKMLQGFYIFWAKKWSPDFWGIFIHVVELFTCDRLDFKERQRREVRALGLLFICSVS